MDLDIGITEARRKEVAEGLARLLADTYTLYVKTQNYHWNVTGPRFRELHLLFEEEYRDLAEAVDGLAERIRTIGFPAPATLTEFSRLSSVSEDETLPGADDMVRKLLEGHETVLRTAREILGLAEAASDHGTVDVVTARIASHEKTGWMLTATF
jgi:starvation-inducible DNA-binding protein